MKQLWGKYRGIVADNLDPLELGRVRVAVPTVLGGAGSAWAMPCVPYAGPLVGFCMAPPIGAAVWVEFEGGDPAHPIWSGCFWREGERPGDAATPDQRLIRTQAATLRFDDTPADGGFTLSVTSPAVSQDVTIRANAAGLEIAIGEARYALSESGFTSLVGM